MKKPNRAFLAVIALAALLPHMPKLLQEKPPLTSIPAATDPAPNPATVNGVDPQPSTSPKAPLAMKEAPQNVADLQADDAISKSDAAIEQAHPWDVMPIAEPEQPQPMYPGETEANVQGQVSPEQTLEKFEQEYLNENFDQTWAAPMEESFHQVFAEALLPDSAVHSAGCRATLCKFEISHADPQAQLDFMRAFIQGAPLALNSQNVFHYDRRDYDGTLQSIYFLTRDSGT